MTTDLEPPDEQFNLCCQNCGTRFGTCTNDVRSFTCGFCLRECEKLKRDLCSDDTTSLGDWWTNFEAVNPWHGFDADLQRRAEKSRETCYEISQVIWWFSKGTNNEPSTD